MSTCGRRTTQNRSLAPPLRSPNFRHSFNNVDLGRWRAKPAHVSWSSARNGLRRPRGDDPTADSMAQARPRTSQFPDGAADVARRFGETVKTLRLYETAGLIRPVRDGHGWRTYGQAECERLHLVLLLRRFGLPARIGEMLSAGQPDLAGILDLQAQALEEQHSRVDEALLLIGRARRHLAEHGSIDRTSLAALARAEPMRLHWTPALAAVATRCFTADQQRRLAQVTPAIESEWEAVYRELAAIIDGPSDTSRARRLGAQAATLIGQITGDDPAMRGAPDPLLAEWIRRPRDQAILAAG